MQLLERGLAQLNRIVDAGVPLVVGDVPDMSLAVGKMLSKAQMPKLETITLANERIRAWAKDKPRVAILPLAMAFLPLTRVIQLELPPSRQ